MRIVTMLVASTILVSACSDNNPSSPVAARTSASASLVPSDQPSKAGKPGGGLTLTTVESALAHMDGVGTTARNAVATCPAGSMVTGGGYWLDSGALSARVQINAPIGGTAWRVLILAAAPEVIDFHAYAICAPV